MNVKRLDFSQLDAAYSRLPVHFLHGIKGGTGGDSEFILWIKGQLGANSVVLGTDQFGNWTVSADGGPAMIIVFSLDTVEIVGGYSGDVDPCTGILTPL